MSRKKVKTDLEKKKRAILRFYNSMCDSVESIEDIPIEKYLILSALTYRELIKPFVVKKLIEKRSQDQIAYQERITRSVVKNIGSSHDLCKK